MHFVRPMGLIALVFFSVASLTGRLDRLSAAEPQLDGNLTIDRQLLAETLRAQRFAGLSGSLTFDENGDRRGETAPELGLRIYRIENNGLVLVE